ncbi:MAG: dockerin type I repeat-containing protein, partial [Oscillospiraceae bacterium]|nr:dockerin type I repeat-containing protein [Oscillospiraceae bacterium]
MVVDVMKKRLSVICIAAATALLLSAFSCSSDTASSMKIYGDLDTDGSVTSADALQVLRFGVSMDTCGEEEKLLSDVDGDGVITAADALDILRYSIGFDTGSLTGKPT